MTLNIDGHNSNNGELDDLDLGDLEPAPNPADNLASGNASQNGAEADCTNELTLTTTSADVTVRVPEARDDAASPSKAGSRTRSRTRLSAPANDLNDDLDDAITNSAAYKRAAAKQAEAALEMERTIAKLRAADPRNRARRLQILGNAVEATYKKVPAHWSELITSIESQITEPRDRQLFEEIVKLDATRARAVTVPAIGPGVRVRAQERPRHHERLVVQGS